MYIKMTGGECNEMNDKWENNRGNIRLEFQM